MFWGLIMEPQRSYSQTVKRAFHISMAALDVSASDDNPTQVICTFDDRNYLLCTLVKGSTQQVALDLNYEIGDKISFATNGKAHVHLTGYLLEDQFPLEEGEEEEEDEEETVKEQSAVTKKRLKKDGDSPPKKKFKTLELLEAVDSNDEDDSDDSDVNTTDFVEDDDMDTTVFDEPESDEDAEEEDDDEETSEEEEEDDAIEGEDSDEESSSLSEDEQVPVAKKTVENGVPSKKEKKQQILQQSPTKSQVQKQQKNEKQKKDKVGKGEKTPAKGDKTSKGDKTPKTKGDQTPIKGQKTPAKGEKSPAKSPIKQEPSSPQKKTIEGGVIIEEVKVGNGALAKPGKFVRVYYEGRFKNNNKMFDSTTKGAGFEFRLGRQEVIKGWDVGVVGMKVGGKRRIICPPNMGYGQKGSPPTIPPNSTLVFEVELKNVK